MYIDLGKNTDKDKNYFSPKRSSALAFLSLKCFCVPCFTCVISRGWKSNCRAVREGASSGKTTMRAKIRFLTHQQSSLPPTPLKQYSSSFLISPISLLGNQSFVEEKFRLTFGKGSHPLWWASSFLWPNKGLGGGIEMQADHRERLFKKWRSICTCQCKCRRN